MSIKHLLAVPALLLSVGLSSQAASAADYAVLLKTLANPFWQGMQTGIQDEAKKLGVEVDIYAAPSEDDSQAQLQLFEDILSRHPKGVAFAPISAVNLVQPAAKAYKAGIAIVDLDERVDMAGLKQAGANVEGFVTTDNVAVGRKGADFIVEKLGTQGGQVAIVEGKAGVASGEARKKGATEGFKAAKGVELVASQPADWDRLKALDVATNTMQSTPDLKAFYCANDTMALGVVQAVQNAGKIGKVIVVGTDGAPEAVASVKAGRLTATVAQDPAKVGAEGLDLLVAAVKTGKLTPVDAEAKQVNVPSILVTKR